MSFASDLIFKLKLIRNKRTTHSHLALELPKFSAFMNMALLWAIYFHPGMHLCVLNSAKCSVAFSSFCIFNAMGMQLITHTRSAKSLRSTRFPILQCKSNDFWSCHLGILRCITIRNKQHVVPWQRLPSSHRLLYTVVHLYGVIRRRL